MTEPRYRKTRPLLAQILTQLRLPVFFALLIASTFFLDTTVAAAQATTPQEQTKASAPKVESQPVPLEPGKPLERELKGGEKHTYEIHAGAGQFLHAEVEQLGIDVALTLYAPDGKTLATMDTDNATFGPEKISTVAEAPGVFRLQVASDDKNAAAGHYRVTLAPLRPPGEQDRARISAERMIVEAAELRSQGRADSLRGAIAKFSQTLPLWHSVGDVYEEGLTQLTIGGVYYALGEKSKALENDAQALPLLRAAGDRASEATALNNIGIVHITLGEMKKALEYFNQALPIRRAVGDRYGEAATLSNMGVLYGELGESRKALDSFTHALSLERAMGIRFGEASTLSNIGSIYFDLADKQKALDYFSQALPLEREVGARSHEAVTRNNIGLIYSDLGDQQKALEYLNQALELHRALGDRSGEAAELLSIGSVYGTLGERQKALDYFAQALPIALAVGDRFSEAATLLNIGGVHNELGEKQKALEYYDQALALFRAVQDPLSQANVLLDMMTAWRDLKQPETAIFFGKQAVNQIQQVRSNIRGLEKEEQRTFLNSKQKTYRELAALLISQGRLAEAEQVLDLLKNQEYFEFIRRDGRDAASLTAPVALTKKEEELARKYEENAATVTAAGNEWTALRAKPSRTPEEEKRLAGLHDRLGAANQAWSKFLDNLYLELGDSKQAQRTVENLQETASSLQGVVRQLGPGAVALYTLVGEEKYHVVLVTPAVQLAREYPLTAAELDKKIAAFRETLLDPDSDPVPQAQELYKILVGPVAKDLEGAQATTLMWSLDGVLRYIPLAALHDGHSYLIEKYRNIVFTPASIAKLASVPSVRQWHGLGVGVSKSYGGFSALPSVPAELHAIIREAGTSESAGVLPGHTLLDDTFTEDNLKKGLSQNYPLVHIASHFVFGAGNDTDSYLLLGGKETEGQRLTLAEINDDPDISFNDVELLTLSACNTALSSPGDGREVDGLGILAQRKGAKAVLATLWSVYDPSTSLLMQTFYRNWTTGSPLSKAEALRRAQLSLLHGPSDQPAPAKLPYSHPYYWAPFILIGNWQ